MVLVISGHIHRCARLFDDFTTGWVYAVSFNLGDDPDPDGSTITNQGGHFTYTLQSHNADTLNITVRVYESPYGSVDPIITTFEKLPSITIDANPVISVPTLELKHGWWEGDEIRAIDPTLIGTVAGFHNPALRTVEFDYNGDGVSDDSALTDGLSQFTFVPGRIRPRATTCVERPNWYYT